MAETFKRDQNPRNLSPGYVRGGRITAADLAVLFDKSTDRETTPAEAFKGALAAPAPAPASVEGMNTAANVHLDMLEALGLMG